MLPLTSASPLILSDELARTGASDRLLQRAHARGEVVRLRRGAYCEAGQWASMDSRERHLLRMRAVAAVSAHETIFCGQSAAAAWALPQRADWDDRVDVAVGDSRGGRSQGDIRRRVLPMQGLRVNELDGLLVTGLASTAVQRAIELDFASAVGILDFALGGRGRQHAELGELLAELARLHPRRHVAQALAAIHFATPLSESFGESLTRARMHVLGYPAPVLQAPISDDRGLIGRVDFYWPDRAVVGEFDGAVKYQRPEYSNGLTPGEVVWREKQREDRLRRRTAGLFRVVWADVMDPARLDVIVRSSGLIPSARA